MLKDKFFFLFSHACLMKKHFEIQSKTSQVITPIFYLIKAFIQRITH